MRKQFEAWTGMAANESRDPYASALLHLRINPQLLERGFLLPSVSGSCFAIGRYGQGAVNLRIHAKNELPVVERNGEPVDWSQWRTCYSSGSVGIAPIQQAWLGGELRVNAGGWHFTSRVGTNGQARFTEKSP